MRISDDTRYPHPVLAFESSDYTSGEFKIAFQVEEGVNNNRVVLRYKIKLDHPDIEALVNSGAARVGAYVRCQDTYYASLERMTWPQGQIEFADGALLNRAFVRPMIWLTRPLLDWTPSYMNPEFVGPVTLAEADIIAIGQEVKLSIGRAKLASVESIFTMKVSDDLSAGTISVDPEGPKVTILAHPEAFKRITDLRANETGKATALAAVYLPAVMGLLDQMKTGSSFEGRRWHAPFMARCDALGIEVEDGDVLEDAQKLLGNPIVGVKISEDAA